MMVSMLYADVIVKKRTRVEELTYAVPVTMVPYIRCGSLVSVPLHRRKVEGVVVRLRRSVPKNLRPKIRDLVTIQRDDQLSDAEIMVLRRLADWYGASLSEVAFHGLDHRVSYPINTKKAYVSIPVFIQASASDRLRAYCGLLKRNPLSSFLFVFAQKTLAESFIQAASEAGLPALFDDRTVRFRKSAQKVVDAGSQLVVVGTSKSIFFPLRRADGLVIDQPSHVGLKQLQRPYMRVETIGRTRADAESLRLILGDDLVGVEDVNRLRSGQWRLVTKDPPSVRMSIVSRLRSPAILLPSVTEQIIRHSAQGQRVLVLALARGWASAYICQECGHVFRCPLCDRTLAIDQNRLVCRYDGTFYSKPTKCPDCRGVTLRDVGEGVTRVISELRQQSSLSSVVELSSDQPDLPDTGVVVATEKALSFPLERYSLIVCTNLDRLLTGTELDDRWRLAKLIKTFSAMTEELVIQTYFPDDLIWSIINSGVRRFFTTELRERRQLMLPPFGEIFHVVGQGDSVQELEAAAKSIIAALKASTGPLAVSAPIFIKESVHRFRVRIVCNVRRFTTREKKGITDQLPPAWYLDVEPGR